ncbi:MAG: TRAM domain-containing protein [Planctomycetales bacterium]|nr:TRAM domain-containing protein [Planctomycetales bacterium]
MALWILRVVFLVVSAGAGFTIINSPLSRTLEISSIWIFAGILLAAALTIGLDVAIRHKRIELISCVYVGILVGVLLSYLVSLAIEPFLDSPGKVSVYKAPIQLMLSVTFSYICVSLLLQTKDDFRFVIPYVEFAKEVKGLKPYILDTSVVIDGRIADVVETNILDSQLLMPRFVLSELQGIADSNDKLRRSRGRRGLDVLNRLRSNEAVDLKIYDRELPEMTGQPVDMKLVLLAKHLEGKVVTGDYNLNKVARLHNVPVINLNDIANALKPVFLPGEEVEVRIVKAGEEDGQGVGYLEDGTMIVVEGGRDHIQKTVRISVTSVLQTSAGRMIFGRFQQRVDRQP